MKFIAAAHNAMPSTIGDRDRISAMDGVLRTAITCRFPFDRDDGRHLASSHLGIETNVGVFRPLDMHAYVLACVHGGTYPKAWEAHHGIKPWVAPRIFVSEDRWGAIARLQDNRIAPGLGVLIDAPLEEDDPQLARDEGSQIWWCTSMDKDRLILCRYRMEPVQDARERVRPYAHTGAPAKRMTIDRAQWEALFAAERAAREQPAEQSSGADDVSRERERERA